MRRQKSYLSKDDAKKLDEILDEPRTDETSPVDNVAPAEEVNNAAKEKVNETTSEKVEEIETILKNFKIYSDMEIMLRSGLLGHFEGEKYKIKLEVAKDLLKMPKIIDKQNLGEIICHGVYEGHTFNFAISYDNLTTYSVAHIYLLEELDKVDEIVPYKTLIGELIRPGGEDILDIVKKEWHLRRKNDEEESGEVILGDLDSVLLGLKTDYVFNSELLEVLSQIYIIRMTTLLSKSGEKGEQILEEFRTRLREIAITRPAVLQKYALMKHILDKTLAKYNGFEIIKQENSKELVETLNSFYEPLKKINVRYFEGEEIPYPSVLRAKDSENTKVEEKTEKKKEKTKGEKPFYLKPAKAGKLTPYKYTKPPEVKEAGKQAQKPKQEKKNQLPPKEKPAPKEQKNNAVEDKDFEMTPEELAKFKKDAEQAGAEEQLRVNQIGKGIGNTIKEELEKTGGLGL